MRPVPVKMEEKKKHFLYLFISFYHCYELWEQFVYLKWIFANCPSVSADAMKNMICSNILNTIIQELKPLSPFKVLSFKVKVTVTDSIYIQICQVESVSLDQHGWKLQLDHSLLFLCSLSISNLFSSYLTAYLCAYPFPIIGINCSTPAISQCSWSTDISSPRSCTFISKMLQA